MTLGQETVHASGGNPRVPYRSKAGRCVGRESSPDAFDSDRHALIRIVLFPFETANGPQPNVTGVWFDRLVRLKSKRQVTANSRSYFIKRPFVGYFFLSHEKHPRRGMGLSKWATTRAACPEGLLLWFSSGWTGGVGCVLCGVWKHTFHEHSQQSG
jgi:hypothetical protein